jgi:flagellar assembly protein FliH
MATVIPSDSIDKHNVDKYSFKVIALGGSTGEKKQEEKATELTPENNPMAISTDVDSSALSNSSKESLIESLMKKTDEMSSNFIKLQMKLEEKEEEFKKELQKAKEEAFAEGMEAGRAKALEDSETNIKSLVEQFSISIKKLEDSSKEFENSLEGIKNELIFAAIDIAKEVIKVEVSENSNEIAKVLSDELIKELQSASKIILKVNPKNHGVISEHVGKLENIDIVSDSAVSEGGVIVLSDAGNIDSQIQRRFERVKKAALSE